MYVLYFFEFGQTLNRDSQLMIRENIFPYIYHFPHKQIFTHAFKKESYC